MKTLSLYAKYCATAAMVAVYFFLMPSSLSNAADKPSVLVSVAPQKYLVERIAGDTIDVTVLVPAGSDPHSYEPTPSQMRAAANAKAYFTVGINFEQAWAPRIVSLSPNLDVIDLSLDGGIIHEDDHDAEHTEQNNSGIPLNHVTHLRSHDPLLQKKVQEFSPSKDDKEHNHDADHDHAHDGDHVWLSPALVRQMVPAMLAELVRIQPENKDLFEKNAQALLVDIDALDASIQKSFKDIPQEKRIFMTFHPSWKNFAHQYDLTELSIEIDGKEPGLRQMTELVKLAKSKGIQVIFIEPQFPKNAAQSIADSIGGSVESADPLAENWLENMQDVATKLSSAMR